MYVCALVKTMAILWTTVIPGILFSRDVPGMTNEGVLVKKNEETPCNS